MVLEIFTYADVVFSGLALLCFAVGLYKGFISQIFGIIGSALSLILAFIVAKPLKEAVRPVFQGIYDAINNDTVSDIISLLIVFAAVALLIKLVLTLIQRMLSVLTERLHVVKTIDRMMGMFLSLAILYCAFAALIGLLDSAPEDFLVSFQETMDTQVYGGKILSALYSSNPLGDWLAGLLYSPS